jgi:hypothetical protein
MKLAAVAIPVSKNFLSDKRIRRATENALDAIAEDMRIDFLVTTQSWKGKPKFTIDRKKSGERVISTDNLIYKFVSGGTRVRYATMSRGFIAKTRSGVIGSGPGRGGRMFVSKMHPRPGIKAREFPKVIARKWKPRLPMLFRRFILDELNR